MKKILFIFGVIFFLSCSGNEENSIENIEPKNSYGQASKPSPQVENAVDAMFYEYVNSDIYIEIDGLISSFNKDLNKDGNKRTFETEEALFSWIKSNIHLTSFKSVQEANQRWTRIKERKGMELRKFNPIYQYIVSAPQKEVVQVLNKWLVPQFNTSIAGDCETSLLSCTLSANHSYMIAINFAMKLEGGNSIKQSAIAIADKTFRVQIEACGHYYNNCKNRTP